MNRLADSKALVAHLLSQRSRREPAWLECSKWICPWRGCLLDGERQDRQEEEENLMLFNGIAAHAVMRGASGMTSGMTPRNSPWFKPDFQDPGMGELSGAREWLDLLDQRMQDCLSKGGFYQAIQNFNMDLLWAGCALLYSESGTRAPLRFESVQVGSYCVALDNEGVLDCVARLVLMPLSSLAASFGEDKLSRASRSALKKEPYAMRRVWQLCRVAKSGRWPVTSLWWEEGGEDFLRESGFYEMPFFFTRWHDGATVYGTGPGDEALPDARQLDVLERRKLAGLGKLVDPPVTAPTQLKDVLDLAPGGINFMPSHEEIKPILDLSPYAQALRHIQEEIAAVSARVQDSLMASIFASIPLNQRPRDMSATEFMERKREALQQLGPVISAYEPDVLNPVLQRVLQSLDRLGLTPPPPRSLQGVNLPMKIDFISPMANALRQSGAEAARALLAEAAAIFKASGNAEVYDKLDLDQAIDELARALGAPGGIVRSDEDVEALRQQRAQAQAAQQEAQQVMQKLQMSKLASEIGANLDSPPEAGE